MSAERWADARRIEAWAGEVRVNLIRAVSVLVFYGYHLLNVYAFKDPGAQGKYHLAATAITLAWTVAVSGLHVCLSRRWVPPGLKYVATFTDLTLVTALLIASPEGPRSPLVVLYFVVLASSPLRLSLALVQATTFGAMAAAAVMLGYHVIYRVTWEVYYSADYTGRVSRTAEVLFLLALGAAGLLAGQAVRQARRLVEGYPVTVAEAGENS